MTAVFALVLLFAMTVPNVSAADSGNTYEFTPTDNANKNYHELRDLVSDDSAKTIVIKPGSDFLVNGMLRPGSNTTIIATGAKITFTKGKNVFFTTPDGNNYDAVKNLKIVGGTWRSQENGGRKSSMMVVSHGSNITFDGVDINANYVGHSIEIIACRDVTVKIAPSRVWGPAARTA